MKKPELNDFFRERPFEYLKRKADGAPFGPHIVRNWYVSRAFVLDKVKSLSVGPEDSGSKHFIVDGDGELLLSAMRQIVLYAHFLNFHETDVFGNLVCENRTRITLVTQMEESAILSKLKKEEYLCNLPDHCKINVFGKIMNKESFLDVEINITDTRPVVEANGILITEKELMDFQDNVSSEIVYSIDTRPAIYANRTYELGSTIESIPYEDIHDPERYTRALDTFRYHYLADINHHFVNDGWKTNQTLVRNGISCIICADCFHIRKRGIEKYASQYGISESKAWKINYNPLSHSEHSRWVVEKLVMGFRPMNPDEKIYYGNLWGAKRKHYIKRLKSSLQDPVHIDICSYNELRRADPGVLKYDVFLMLAIPFIMEKVQPEVL